MTVQTTGRAPWWRVLLTKRSIGLILAAVALVLPNLIDIDGLSEAGERMLGIFGPPKGFVSPVSLCWEWPLITSAATAVTPCAGVESRGKVPPSKRTSFFGLGIRASRLQPTMIQPRPTLSLLP